MPIFEYSCDKCGTTVELISKEIKKVRHCGSVMKTKVSKTTFQLKGKGWEKDGYQK